MHIVMNREEGKHQRPTHTWFPMFTPQYKDAKFQLYVQHQGYDRSEIVINKVEVRIFKEMLGYWVFSVCYKGTFIVKCMTIKRFAGEISKFSSTCIQSCNYELVYLC